MPALFGFILGVLVTIGGAYAYDAESGRTPNGLTSPAADGQAPMVNWDVVGNHWSHLQENMRVQAERLEQTLKRHIG